jgi:hypothetical protein
VTDETTRLIPPTAWGLLLFLFGGAAFAKVNDDPAFTAATHHHPALAVCLYALAVSAVTAAAVMGLATVPSLVLLLRQGKAQARRDAAPLLVVLLGLGCLSGAVVVARSFAGRSGPHAASNTALFIGLCVVSLGVGVGLTIALIRVAVRVPEKPVVVASRRAAMIALAVCTTVAAAAVAGWVVTLAATERHLLTSNDGLLASPVTPTLAVILAVLTVAATLCVRSGWAALSSPGGAPRSSH